MLSQSFKFFIEYVSDSIEFFFYTPSIFWRSFFFLFPFARFILSIFEEEEKNFRNKRLVDNLEGGKWSRFFMESDSFFEFFFSLFHPFFDHSFPFARFILSILRKNSQRVDNLEEGKWSLFLWNQILSNSSFRYSIHFFPFARFILSIFEKEEKNFRNKRLVDNLEGEKWSRFFIRFFFRILLFVIPSISWSFFSFRKIYFINLRRRREEFSK